MICEQCQRDGNEKDFFKSQVCYRCSYKNKMSLLNPKKIPENKICKICKENIPACRLIYWKASYCSEECAKLGKDKHNKTYWLRTLHSQKAQGKLQYGKSEPI